MPYINLESLLRPNTTPDQELFLNGFYQKFNNGISVIKNVEPLMYQGVTAATEFLVYDVKKLYIAYTLATGVYTLAIPVTIFFLYDESNALSFQTTSLAPYWDAVALATKWTNIELTINNYYFSRLTASTYLKFFGYRITLQ